MNEDDTFKKLKQISIKDMDRLLVNEERRIGIFSSTMNSFWQVDDKFFEQYSWSKAEFRDKYNTTDPKEL